jgi:hypothetical protein
VDRCIPGRDQLLLPRDVLGEPLRRPRRRQVLRDVRRQPGAQVVPEDPLIVGEVELHVVRLRAVIAVLSRRREPYRRF